MDNIHAGSCLCGAVHYQVDGALEQFYLCHCRHCRKDTGSAHAANLFSSHAALQWISGHDKVTSFNLPSTRHRHSFCRSEEHTSELQSIMRTLDAVFCLKIQNNNLWQRSSLILHIPF